METANWSGYEFNVHDPDATRWYAVGGLYIFSALERDHRGVLVWRAEYVGKTRSLADRLPTHRRWPEAVRRGATRIHARAESNAQSRSEIEGLLIREFQPPMNFQGR